MSSRNSYSIETRLILGIGRIIVFINVVSALIICVLQSILIIQNWYEPRYPNLDQILVKSVRMENLCSAMAFDQPSHIMLIRPYIIQRCLEIYPERY